jgi:hypothetical protein
MQPVVRDRDQVIREASSSVGTLPPGVSDPGQMLAQSFEQLVALRPGLIHQVSDGVLAERGLQLPRCDRPVCAATDPGASDISVPAFLEITDSIFNAAADHRTGHWAAIAEPAVWRRAVPRIRNRA